MTARRKPRDPDMPREGAPVTPADVEARIRRAGELRLDVEIAAVRVANAVISAPHKMPAKQPMIYAAPQVAVFHAALSALHAMLVEEIKR